MQFVQFCEHLESTENVPSGNGTKHGQDNKKDKDTHGPPGRNHICRARCNSTRGQTENKYCIKCGKGNDTTNGCWIVRKQLGLPLSDIAKVHFQKQGGSLEKKHKTYSEKEINTMISEKVEAAMKARETNPKETDEGDAEGMNMEEFNCDPTLDTENE